LNVIVNLIVLPLVAAFDGTSPATTPQSSAVPMHDLAWTIRYSPGMRAHPLPQETGGWYFDFPTASGSVHYVTAAVNMVVSKSVSADIEVRTTGAPRSKQYLCQSSACTTFVATERR
jgi:hypothetical protein